MKGFSAMLANPPYLGGSKISEFFGPTNAKFLRDKFEGGAKADLISYFTKNSFDHLASMSSLGIVTTNALRSGESRKCGLYPLLREKTSNLENGSDMTEKTKGRITDAATDIVWPGDAAVTVDLLTVKKEDFPYPKNVKATLNSIEVDTPISSRLNLRVDLDPITLEENKSISQRGVNPRGLFR